MEAPKKIDLLAELLFMADMEADDRSYFDFCQTLEGQLVEALSATDIDEAQTKAQAKYAEACQ